MNETSELKPVCQNGIYNMQVFFCTVGFGLESFTQKELSNLPTDVCIKQVLVVEPEIDSIDNWIERILKPELCQLDDKLLLWKQLSQEDCEIIKFRVNCRLSGKFRKAHLFKHLSALIGNLLTKKPSFIVDLKNQVLDVFVHLNDNYFTVGLPVTRQPLSNRNYLKHIALRSTVCCAMCMAAGLQPEDVVLDPMCGAATLLVEAVRQFKAKTCFGIDIAVNQLEEAKNNICASRAENHISLICGNSSKRLFRGHCIDVVLCDVPFGRKFGQRSDIKRLYTQFIETVSGVVNRNGRVCILVCQDLKQTLLDLSEKWILLNQHPVRLGILEAVILVWKVQ